MNYNALKEIVEFNISLIYLTTFYIISAEVGMLLAMNGNT